MTLRTLVVDDAANLRTLLGIALAADGRFEVVAEACDGLEAIDAATLHRPDLVLLDLNMPRLSGLEALPWILRATPQARVVVFTGFTDPAVQRQACEAGAAGVIEKGVAPAALCDQVLALVAPAAVVGNHQ